MEYKKLHFVEMLIALDEYYQCDWKNNLLILPKKGKLTNILNV